MQAHGKRELRKHATSGTHAERLGLGPSPALAKEEALTLQLKALQLNNMPYSNHGIEVAYRFAKFDPFERSKYFGKRLDLGQFERFKRVFFTPWFKPLIGHTSAAIVSQLTLTDDVWRSRWAVQHGKQGQQEATYDITLVRDRTGVHKDLWMTLSVLRDDHEGIESFL